MSMKIKGQRSQITNNYLKESAISTDKKLG